MSENNLEHVYVQIAEGNKHMMNILKRTLADLGVTRIGESTNGLQTISALRERLPDILIINIDLPPAGGLDIVKFIRKDHLSPSRYLPVVLASSTTNRKQVFDARDAGANEFLVMPFSAQTLASRLNAIVKHPRPFIKAGEYFGPDRRRKKSEEYEGPERRGKKNTGLSSQQIAELLNQNQVNEILETTPN